MTVGISKSVIIVAATDIAQNVTEWSRERMERESSDIESLDNEGTETNWISAFVAK